MSENNPKSKPTMAQKIAWLKREIPWTYQREDAKGMMRESSGYLPVHELEKDQALTAEVLNSVPAEDRTHWRAVREEIVREHLKAGRSKAVEVVNAELAHRVTRHYPHTDIDVSIMRKRQSQIENMASVMAPAGSTNRPDAAQEIRHRQQQQLAEHRAAVQQASQLPPVVQHGFSGPAL